MSTSQSAMSTEEKEKIQQGLSSHSFDPSPQGSAFCTPRPSKDQHAFSYVTRDQDGDDFIRNDDSDGEVVGDDLELEGPGAGTSLGFDHSMGGPFTSANPSEMDRVFIVTKLLKAGGSYRPAFLFEGFLAELSSSSNTGSSQVGRVVALGVTLSVRYEPPSPKFARERPNSVSYRVKFLQDSNFLYLVRGLPSVVVVDGSCSAVSWGALSFVFLEVGDLARFTGALKYVVVVDGPVSAGRERLALDQLVSGMMDDASVAPTSSHMVEMKVTRPVPPYSPMVTQITDLFSAFQESPTAAYAVVALGAAVVVGLWFGSPARRSF